MRGDPVAEGGGDSTRRKISWRRRFSRLKMPATPRVLQLVPMCRLIKKKCGPLIRRTSYSLFHSAGSDAGSSSLYSSADEECSFLARSPRSDAAMARYSSEFECTGI